MTLDIRHAATSATPDDGVSDVGSDEWNAALTAEMATGKILGRTTAGTGAVEELSPSSVRDLIGVSVATRTALKALDTSIGSVTLTESGREGTFVWRTGDYSTECTADTAEGIYLVSNGTASTSGAWIRVSLTYTNPRWFGAVGDGVTDDVASFEAAYAVIQAIGGGTLFIPDGNYLVGSTINYTSSVDVTVIFDAGATLIANTNLAEPVLYFYASTDGVGDVTVINPQIDCSDGYYILGAQSCTAIAFARQNNAIVRGGYLYGGEAYNSDNADSGVTATSCRMVLVDGVRIKGFSDAAFYPTGGATPSDTSDDGTSATITNCLVEHCGAVVTAKRELNHLIAEGNTVKRCSVGIATSWITSPAVLQPCRRATIVANTFIRMRSQAIDVRGTTRGIVANNGIYGFGYESDDTTEVAGVAKAINVQGASGLLVIGNRIEMDGLTATDHVAFFVAQETIDATPYTPTGNIFKDNTIVDLFCMVSESSAGANFYLDNHLDNVTQISGTLNAGSLVTYTKAGSTVKNTRINAVTRRVTEGPTTTTDNTLPRYDSTAGLLQGSGVVVDDSNNVSGVASLASTGLIKSSSATAGIGYAAGAGGAVTQNWSRTTGVTLNTVCGSITLFSAAGRWTPTSFTVTNSAVAATDTVIVSQKSGTDKYAVIVTAVADGSFEITFWDLTGTRTEQPVFSFSVIKAVAA